MYDGKLYISKGVRLQSPNDIVFLFQKIIFVTVQTLKKSCNKGDDASTVKSL